MTATTTLHTASALAGFMRATAGDLPEPRAVNIHGALHRQAQVNLMFDTLADLREWAQMLGVELTGGDRLTHHGTYHHSLRATWPAHDMTPVVFEAVFIETPAVECSSEMEMAAR